MNVIGFTPNYYENQQSAGLNVYISPGTIGTTLYNGQVVTVPANATTEISINSQGQVQFGFGPGLYSIAIVVSGQVQTSGTPNTLPVYSNGILSITDVRPASFSF